MERHLCTEVDISFEEPTPPRKLVFFFLEARLAWRASERLLVPRASEHDRFELVAVAKNAEPS
jgi:hypothetical protein